MSDSECSVAEDSCTEYESDLYDTDVFELKDGLNLMVSRHKKTLKSIANLVLTVNKMSKSLSQCGRDLSDDQLCSAIMDCVLEETVLQTNGMTCTGQRRVIYQRSNSMRSCTLSDDLKKHLVLQSGELKAISLRAEHCNRKVKFMMSRYSPTFDNNAKAKTVVLSLPGNLHISCSKVDGRVVMNLEICSEMNLEEICLEQDMDRFLFFMRSTEISNTMFESVKYHGWFISTSSEEWKSVQMCQVDACQRITRFSVFSENTQ